jgi:hypothetical protein
MVSDGLLVQILTKIVIAALLERVEYPFFGFYLLVSGEILIFAAV